MRPEPSHPLIAASHTGRPPGAPARELRLLLRAISVATSAVLALSVMPLSASTAEALVARAGKTATPVPAQATTPVPAQPTTSATAPPTTAALTTTVPPRPLLPTADPFYTYSGPLAHVSPGTVLKVRSLPVGAGARLAITQVLYRTTGQLGGPAITVATIIAPENPSGPRRIVAYQEAYDGLGPQCEPSYELQSGIGDLKVISPYLSLGLVFVLADYEGTHFEWTAGQAAGYATLDAVRAAENFLRLPHGSTPVGLVGYSGGATATEFATELAPRYATGLDIVGAAEGGLSVDLAHNLQYINGSSYWSAVIPMSLVGLGRAFHIPLNTYLSAYGQKVTAAVSNQCLGREAGKYPGLTVQRLFKPEYHDIFAIPTFTRVLNRLIMGRTGTPRVPLFIGEGNSDGTGDGIMVFKDVEALAHTYCQRGVSVLFQGYKGRDHNQAARLFVAGALGFLGKAFLGLPPANNCSSIGPGGSLAPLR
jgi:hypothetical protein